MNINVISLKVVKEKELTYKFDDSITSPMAAVKILQDYIGDSDREHFVIIMLDVKNKINAIHTVSTGSLVSSIVHPREVFKAAIIQNSSSIILGHNHPSGVVDPSNEDLDTTQRLVNASEILGIKILDHIIVSDNNYLSFKEKGWI